LMASPEDADPVPVAELVVTSPPPRVQAEITPAPTAKEPYLINLRRPILPNRTRGLRDSAIAFSLTTTSR
jgi:hypothetical protein